MKKETDDFESHPSFEEEGRAAEGKRSFQIPEAASLKQRQSQLSHQCCERWPRNCKSRAKNTCWFLETAALGTCPLYVCSLDSASVGTDPVPSW